MGVGVGDVGVEILGNKFGKRTDTREKYIYEMYNASYCFETLVAHLPSTANIARRLQL